MTNDRLFDLHRLRYWTGQRLRSRDLNDQLFFDAHLRAWHNRALHESYGVVSGLQVALDLAASEVVVEPGYAYDARGRIIYLPERSHLSIPGNPLEAASYFLTLEEEAALQKAVSPQVQSAGGSSLMDGLARGRLAWVRPTRFDPRIGIVLTRLEPGPALAPDFSAQRARPLARPQVAHGATISGRSVWKPWILKRAGPPPSQEKIAATEAAGELLSELPPDLFLGLQVDVDTSASGFTNPPRYFATLQGSLWETALQERIAAQNLKGHDQGASVRQVVDEWLWLQLLGMRFGHIHKPSVSGFTYRIWLPQVSKWTRGSGLLTFAQQLTRAGGLTVAWVGVADRAACEPKLPVSISDAGRQRSDERKCYGNIR